MCKGLCDEWTMFSSFGNVPLTQLAKTHQIKTEVLFWKKAFITHLQFDRAIKKCDGHEFLHNPTLANLQPIIKPHKKHNFIACLGHWIALIPTGKTVPKHGKELIKEKRTKNWLF